MKVFPIAILHSGIRLKVEDMEDHNFLCEWTERVGLVCMSGAAYVSTVYRPVYYAYLRPENPGFTFGYEHPEVGLRDTTGVFTVKDFRLWVELNRGDILLSRKGNKYSVSGIDKDVISICSLRSSEEAECISISKLVSKGFVPERR